MTAPSPRSIPEYLDQLRAALAGADPALVQDALYDAEDYLRSEFAANPGVDETALLASIAGSYGAPEEVADIYRQTETTVIRALRPPPVRPRTSLLGKFFGVLADPRAYTALLYMLLSMATGVFYFTWTTTGLSLTVGLSILIIGIPLAILFFASVRGISLIEGRLVEVMLGERMPRRPAYADREQPMLERIKQMFTDPRTWGSVLYLLLMMPLGIAYFTFAITALATTFGLAFTPITDYFFDFQGLSFGGSPLYMPLWMLPLTLALGTLMFAITLHIARGVGYLHAQLAKHLLVKWAQG